MTSSSALKKSKATGRKVSIDDSSRSLNRLVDYSLDKKKTHTLYLENAVASNSSDEFTKNLFFRDKVINSKLELFTNIKSGIDPVDYAFVITILSELLDVEPPVSRSTIDRMKKGKTKPAPASYFRIYEYARVFHRVAKIFNGNEEKIHKFMNSKNALLEDLTPEQVLEEYGHIGVDLIVDLLDKVDAGVGV